MTGFRSVLVTGATGMLGRATVDAARARGHSVAGLARTETDFSIDLADQEALARVLDSFRPDVVINTAALTDIAAVEADPGTAWPVNAGAVSVLAELCRTRGSRLVQISTDHYFTGDGRQLHDERAPVVLLNDYARQKYAAEAFALTLPGALVVRTNIVGFRDHGPQGFADWARDVVDGDKEETLFTDVFVSSIDVGSCAEALLNLIDAGAEGILNVASREVFSKRDFVHRLAAARGRRLTRAVDGSVESLGVRRADSLGLDVTRAERILGYALPGMQQVVDVLAGATAPGRRM